MKAMAAPTGHPSMLLVSLWAGGRGWDLPAQGHPGLEQEGWPLLGGCSRAASALWAYWGDIALTVALVTTQKAKQTCFLLWGRGAVKYPPPAFLSPVHPKRVLATVTP